MILGSDNVSRYSNLFHARFRSNNVSSNADLLGLSTPPSNANSNQGTLIDVLGDIYSNGNSAVHNAKK